MKNAAEKAYLLADASQQALGTQAGPEGLAVSVPRQAPDPICSVVVLRVQGELEIELPVLSQQADGVIALPASEAICHGHQIKFESGHNRDNIGYWLDPSDWVEWQFQVSQPGKFTLSAEIAAHGSGAFEIRVGDRNVSATCHHGGA